MQLGTWLKQHLNPSRPVTLWSGLLGALIVYMLIQVGGAGYAFGKHLAQLDDARDRSALETDHRA